MVDLHLETETYVTGVQHVWDIDMYRWMWWMMWEVQKSAGVYNLHIGRICIGIWVVSRSMVKESKGTSGRAGQKMLYIRDEKFSCLYRKVHRMCAHVCYSEKSLL